MYFSEDWDIVETFLVQNLKQKLKGAVVFELGFRINSMTGIIPPLGGEGYEFLWSYNGTQ